MIAAGAVGRIEGEGGVVLKTHMVKGAKIVGLAPLLKSGRPAFDGCYRVVPLGGVIALEFFDAATRQDAADMHRVRILPYRVNMIAEAVMGGAEVISGEFTGCVMTTFTRNGGLVAGHVDTDPATSQRAAYDTLKQDGTVTPVDEFDSTGVLPPLAGKKFSRLCARRRYGDRIPDPRADRYAGRNGILPPRRHPSSRAA